MSTIASRPRTEVGVVPERYASRLRVRQDGRVLFVNVGDVDWIEADRNYVKLHVSGAVHTMRERISHLEESLDPTQFVRIHRSTIVNRTRIRDVQPWLSGDSVVLLEDGTRLRRSRYYRGQVARPVGHR